MMQKYPYESCFAGLIVKPLVSEEKDKCLALASLVEIRHFLPNIDTSVNLDILPVAFNACVINRVNKNRDVVDTTTALAMHKHFINKPINVEHNRQKVIGTILTVGFSEFGSDRPLTDEQVKTMTGPFNITLGGIIWRVVCPELADHIEESSDATSDKYLSVSASWELGFSDYRVALFEAGVKNLAEAKQIISDPKQVDEIRDKLTSLGGDGKVNDLFAYRMPSYDVLPLGIGFTEKPAAEVLGVATPQKDKVGIVIPESFDDGAKKTPVIKPVPTPQPTENNQVGIVIPKSFEDKKKQSIRNEILGDLESQNKISQMIIPNVKIEGKYSMKITSLQDISEASIKDVAPAAIASAVSDFIAAELKKGSDTWETQKNALNTQLAKAQEDGQKLQAEQTKLQDQIKQVQATVDTLQAEKTAREAVEKFNTRMSTIAESYELDDEVRAAIVDDIKALASDEEFTKWLTKAKVLLKGFAKKAPMKKDDDKDDDCKGKKDAKANEDAEAKKKADAAAAATAVAAAVDNGNKDKGGLPNGSTANSPTLKEKYQAAFAKENFEIRV